MNEMWKLHPTLNHLLVSNLGRVKTEDRMVKSGNGFRIQKSQILSQSDDKDGYQLISFNGGNGRKTYKVHRLVAETFIENPLNLPEVNHIDGNKRKKHVSNLEFCSREQNVRHSINTGLRKVKQYNIVKCKYCSKEFQSSKDKKLYCSIQCLNNDKKRSSNIPDEHTLYNLLIAHKSFDLVGEIYSVSRTTIKRWCLSYGIPSSVKYYKNNNS